MPRKEPPYEVGYGKPPKEGQFRKGNSGNPRGRPKGSLNVLTVLERTARETITINIQGCRKTVTKLEAAAMQMSNKSASGDLKAITLMFNFLRSITKESGEEHNDQALDANDKIIITSMLKRLGMQPGGKK